MLADASNADLKVIIKMSNQTVRDQLDSGYRLSVVRNVVEGKTEKNGNIVFLQTAKLAVSTSLSWSEKYRVTESTTEFKEGGTVALATDPVEIELGQSITFYKKSGHSDPSGNPDPTKPITVINEWIRSSVVVENFDPNSAVSKYSQIYISTPNNPDTTSTLTPIKKFGLFWSKEEITNTMIETNKSTKVHLVDLTKKPEAQVSYDAETGKWDNL